MTDYINREMAFKEFAEFVRGSNNSDFVDAPTWNDAVSLIGSLPAADAVPVVHGEWKPGKEISRTMLVDGTLAIEYDAFYCSACGRRYKEYVLVYNYCPNCGAKMDGGDRQ